MGWTRVGFGIALAGTLVANGYLLLSSGSAETAVSTTAADARPTSPKRTHRRIPVQGPASVAVLAVPPSIAIMERGALENRLAAAEGKLNAMIPLHEAFELEARSAENESRLEPFLDNLFDVDGASEPRYDLECRGRVCRVESLDASHDTTALQSDPAMVGLFSGQEFGPDAAFVKLEDRGRAAGIQLSFKLIMALATSPALITCRKANPAPAGVVELALRFDAGSRRLSVAATGSLANQAGGVCIRNILEELIAATPVPPEVTSVREDPVSVGIR